ncbi:heat-inducible transcriptional repressor HrcA [Amorphus orientalis]|uniref:Heat-inducible transcription repressor HrcA n=1 Tax=Amorphus orientalis TaxID=649198 RepID=A0AAE3VKI6_9HYPH|nr:heat-inducible transcriptional repressor HrcA [Amorphus orientalis]MDQ0313712.1 heat-inducible transcriptional repressor [Amorphus orientalis]
MSTDRFFDPPRSHLVDLDARSRDIFKQIVESYLETGEPIGSRNISKRLATALSPASVRNVMADLESLGLIYAPHTSAGRLPTEIGLRFFVDALLEVGDLSDQERAGIDAHVRSGDHDRGVEGLLHDASQLLSGLSRGAGVVAVGKADLRVKHVEFVRLDAQAALVVLVGDNGSVENRIVDLPAGLPPSALTEASNYLNAHIRGKTLTEAIGSLKVLKDQQQAELDELTQRLVQTGIASWAGSDETAGGTLIVHGRANLLEDVTAQEDLERIRRLFEDLESKNELLQLLSLADEGEGVRIFIGSENKLFSLSGSSLVVSPYRDESNRIVGALGVIGPTRLNYGRVIPMVDYTARLVGKLVR